jgi:hypothetical protein
MCQSPNVESNTTFSSFLNNSATYSISLYFYGKKHTLRSCNIHRNSQGGTSYGLFYATSSAALTISKCSIKGNVCPGRHFYASSDSSITVSESCYDDASASGDVSLASVSPFEYTLVHLSLGLCDAQFLEVDLSAASASSLFGVSSGQKCILRRVPGSPVLVSVLVLCFCDPFQTFLTLRTSFLIFNKS